MTYMQLPKEHRNLTERDHDLIKTLRTHCRHEGESTFTSDTFRMLGLDRFVDNKHGIGGFFAKLLANKYAEQVDWTRSVLPSNHGRKIRVYKWRVDETP